MGSNLRFAIYLCAPNDRNGNPRRGWAVFRVNECGSVGERWVEEGYHGTGALKLHYDPVPPWTTVNVSAKELHGWRKGEWIEEVN